MHDPNILAFEIKYPWWKDKPWPKKFRHPESRKFTWEHRMSEQDKRGRSPFWDCGYRDTFISIWHVDPEKGGDDDSCGWSYPKCTPEQRERIRNVAWIEARNPYFLKCSGRQFSGTMAEAESLERGLLLLVADVLRVKLTYEEALRMAARTIHHADCVHPANKFCFEPGYHSNSKKDRESDREEVFQGICFGAARRILAYKRPWWKHPRWHFWHWRFQVHPWQTIKRGLFDRCSICGKGFGFREPVMSDWNGTKIWHDRCQTQPDHKPLLTH